MQIFEIIKNNINVEFDDITLPTQFHTVKAVIFPIVMYGCESWTTKKAGSHELMLLNYGAEEDS